MNILVISENNLYTILSRSFVHAQAAAYSALGHRVLCLIPFPLGKTSVEGKRFFQRTTLREIDGVEICYYRYLSLSIYGKSWFNTASALHSLKSVWRDILGDFRPDIIHAHALGFASEIGAFLKDQLHVPLVVTTHGGDTFRVIRVGYGKRLLAAAQKPDQIVAVSSSLKRALLDIGVTTPIDVILNGFRVRDIVDVPRKRPFSLIQVGHLIKLKKVHVTMQAFSELQKRYPEATLTVIGEGPERKSLEVLGGELAISEHVRFLGQVPNQTVLSEMAQTQFFVMASSPEGFGIVYLEAMASGCVTIGTEGEGIADLIVSGENGFLVPPDDPEAIVRTIEWCLEHPDEAAAIAERGRSDAMGLTWEKNAGEYIRIFEEMIESCR